MRIRGRQISPALVVAIVALVAALGGTAVGGIATSALTKKEFKQVKRIAKNKANAQIKKKAPGLSVAHADDADSATNAANANDADDAAAVDGNTVTKIAINQGSGNVAEQVLYNAHGLILRGSCNAGLENIIADTTVANSELSSVSDDALASAPFNVNDDDFDPGDNVEITPATPNDQVYNLRYLGADGEVVIGQLSTEGPGNGTCELGGFVIGG